MDGNDLLDKRAIQDLAARFADACTTRNVAAFRALWLPDGVWDIGNPLPAHAHGVDDVVQMLQRLLDSWEFFVQMNHSGVIRVDGDAASARWIVQETARKPENTGYYNNFAVYEDQLSRRDGRWFFASRTYEYIYLDDAKLSGQAFRVAPTLDL